MKSNVVRLPVRHRPPAANQHLLDALEGVAICNGAVLRDQVATAAERSARNRATITSLIAEVLEDDGFEATGTFIKTLAHQVVVAAGEAGQ